jgi:hypothetical protein
MPVLPDYSLKYFSFMVIMCNECYIKRVFTFSFVFNKLKLVSETDQTASWCSFSGLSSTVILKSARQDGGIKWFKKLKFRNFMINIKKLLYRNRNKFIDQLWILGAYNYTYLAYAIIRQVCIIVYARYP